jgi:hypothetical protein
MDNTLEHQPGQEEQGDFWNELPEHVKLAIEQAKEELNSGKGIPRAEVMAEVEAMFLNR